MRETTAVRHGVSKLWPPQGWDKVMQREETAVEIISNQGCITLPAGGRLLDFLNTRPEMIALAGARDSSGTRHPFVAVNIEQVLAIRPGIPE